MSEYQEIINCWTKNASSKDKITTLFEKVRDIPYGNINSRNPLDVYKQNKGTCSGKHELLKNLYKELNVPVKEFVVKHYFNQLPVNFPENIKTYFELNKVIDYHNFLKIKIDEKWITIDATWDINLKPLGFYVTENWDGKSDMQIAVCSSDELYESAHNMLLKNELIGKLTKQQQLNRKQFLMVCTTWLDSLRAENII